MPVVGYELNVTGYQDVKKSCLIIGLMPVVVYALNITGYQDV
jgi:hypothetical protein